LIAIAKQVYLLTLVDRATLPNAKSTISRCTPSIITRQWALVHSKLLRIPAYVSYWHTHTR